MDEGEAARRGRAAMSQKSPGRYTPVAEEELRHHSRSQGPETMCEGWETSAIYRRNHSGDIGEMSTTQEAKEDQQETSGNIMRCSSEEMTGKTPTNQPFSQPARRQHGGKEGKYKISKKLHKMTIQCK